MHINLMRLNLADVFVSNGLVENFGDFARHLGAVNLHEKVFHDFRFHRGNVFLGNVGVGVHFRAVRRVLRADVVIHELQFAV